MKSGDFDLIDVVVGLCVFALFCVGAFYLGKKYERPKGQNELVLAECERLVEFHTPHEIQFVSPVVAQIGHSGPRGSSVETQVIWKNELSKVNVVCIGWQPHPSVGVKIHRFVVDGKPVNILSKREER